MLHRTIQALFILVTLAFAVFAIYDVFETGDFEGQNSMAIFTTLLLIPIFTNKGGILFKITAIGYGLYLIASFYKYLVFYELAELTANRYSLNALFGLMVIVYLIIIFFQDKTDLRDKLRKL